MMAKVCVLLLLVFIAIRSSRSSGIISTRANSTGNVITVANLPFQVTNIATKLWSIFQESQRTTDSKLAIGRIGLMEKIFGCKPMDDLLPAMKSCKGSMADFRSSELMCKNLDKVAKIVACTIDKLDCLPSDFPIRGEAKSMKALQGACKHRKAILCYKPIGQETMNNPFGTCINKALTTGHENVKTLDDAMNLKFQCKNKDQMAKWWLCQQKKRLDCLSSENQEKYNLFFPTEKRWGEIIQFQCDKQDVLRAECGMFNTEIKCALKLIPEMQAGVDKTPCQWMENIKTCISSNPGSCSDEYIAAQKQIIDMVFCGKRYDSPAGAGTDTTGSSSNKESGSSSNKESGSSSNKKNKSAAQKNGTGNNKMTTIWLIICALESYIGSW